jgi:hypothetical protein
MHELPGYLYGSRKAVLYSTKEQDISFARSSIRDPPGKLCLIPALVRVLEGHCGFHDADF